MFIPEIPVLIFSFVLSALFGYLLGSVNCSIILTRIFKEKADIRKYGSGNAGMTNVLRTVGKVPAALTFVGDFLKCVAAVLLSMALFSLAGLLTGGSYGPYVFGAAKYAAGVACVLGHIFPVYYGFRGGKGVVTAAAMISLTDWRVFLLVLGTFVLLFALKRIVSLASVTCAATYPAYTFLLTFLDYYQKEMPLWYSLFAVGAALFVGVTVLVKHRSNIGRLKRGEEKPVVFGKKK